MERNRVLLMCPDFFDYSDILIREIKKENEVDFFFNNFIEKQNKIIRKFFKRYIFIKNNQYYRNILNKIKYNKYDYFLFIKGNNIPNFFFEELLKNNKKIRVISYQWDDIENCIEILEKRKFIDKFYTYSKYDAEKYTMDYMPMFLLPDNEKTFFNKKYDILNVITLHKSRIEIVNNLNSKKELIIKNHIILDSIKAYCLYLKLKKKYFKIKKVKLKYKEYLKLIDESKAILDLPINNQKGLTTRVMEALSRGTKVITFNQEIKKYSFYNEEYILLLSEIELEKIKKFISKESENMKYVKEYLKNYYIENWINKILK